jgi:hypothetical protein
MRDTPSRVSYCTRSTLVFCKAPLSPACEPVLLAAWQKVSSPADGSDSPECSIATSTRSGKSETITFSTESLLPLLFTSGKVSRHASAAAAASPSCAPLERPQRCAAKDTIATTPAISRESSCSVNSVLLGSVLIGVCKPHVASFAAIGTIIQPIYAHANVELRLAEAAVLFTSTLLFRLFAYRAKSYHLPALQWPRISPFLNLRSCACAGQAPCTREFPRNTTIALYALYCCGFPHLYELARAKVTEKTKVTPGRVP